MIYNRIPVEIGPDRRVTTQPINYQYDVQQILVISGAAGVELPAFFTVDFCNVGDADTQPIAGSASGVMIPDSLLQTGKNIMAYFVIAGPGTAAQTRYEITIPVNARPEGTDIDPTEDQQRQIDALIETLNEGVEGESKRRKMQLRRSRTWASKQRRCQRDPRQRSGKKSIRRPERSH